MTSEVTTIFNVGWQNSSSIGQQHHLLKAQCYGIAFSLQQLSQTSIADLIKKNELNKDLRQVWELLDRSFFCDSIRAASIVMPVHLCP